MKVKNSNCDETQIVMRLKNANTDNNKTSQESQNPALKHHIGCQMCPIALYKSTEKVFFLQ